MSGLQRSSWRGPSIVGWVLVGLVTLSMVAIAAWRHQPTEGDSEERLYALAGQVKCEQCVGETVAGSNTDFAVAARQEIRRGMQAGRSDDEILARFVESYGSDVLLNPPSTGLASLVWVIPPVVAGLAVLGLVATWRSRRSAAPEPDVLDDEDRQRVDTAMAEYRREH